MEHERLVRTLDFLEKNSIVVGTLVTDRHKQIAKYIREMHPEITHQYDVWHISSGTVFFTLLANGNLINQTRDRFHIISDPSLRF